MRPTKSEHANSVSASAFRSAWENPGFLLWHAALQWQRATAAALRPFDITHVQFVLLASTWWLGEQGHMPSQRELAEHSGTDQMMTSQVVRTLETKGLLTRTSDPSDSRRRRLNVTPAGRKLAPQAIAAVETADREYFVAASKQTDLLTMLKTLARTSA